MVTCTVQYSADVAVRAIRTYFWRKFRTPFGAFYLGSYPLIIGMIAFTYYMQGANWFVGAFGSLVFFNLLMQWSNWFTLPRAIAKRLTDPANRTAEVTTSAEGIRIAIGQAASFVKWAMIKYIWFYDDFVILALKPPLLMRSIHLPTAGMTPELRRDLAAASQGEAIA
jgi:hypothetical protein